MSFRTADSARYAIEAKRANGEHIPEPIDEVAGEPVYARIDWARWVGDCNQENPAKNRICRGAQLLAPTDRRFFCTSCQNAANGGRWRPVIWPEEHLKVELGLRGLRTPEQNWTPEP